MEAPIELIHINENGKCILNKNAMEILESIEAPLSIICVAGPYRTGKSYLLSRFLGKQEAFKIGSTTQPLTKGIWMWGKPQKNATNSPTILLDTEGFGSGDRDDKTDSKIFAISLLLSSMFIYNVSQQINEKAIEYLGMILNLAQYIHVKSKNVNTSENLEEYSNYFPSFLWVIRDFSLKLEGSEKQYMESALRPANGNDEATKYKNDIRQAISTYFQERDCSTLVRPCIDESEINKLNLLSYDNLRPVFKEQIEKLITKVYTVVRPKSINNTPLNGRMYASMVRSYIAALNSDSVPIILDTWAQIVDNECKIIYGNTMLLYEEQKKKMYAEFPMEEKELRSKLAKIKDAAYEIMLKSGFQGSDIYIAYVNKLSHTISVSEEDAHQENSKKSEQACNKILDDSIAIFNSQKVENYTITYVIENISNLRTNYISVAKGPAKYDVYFKKMDEFQFAIIKKLLDTDSDRVYKELQKTKTELAQERGVNKAHMESVEAMKKTSNENIGINEEKYKTEIENYKATINKLTQDYEELNKILKEENALKFKPNDLTKKAKMNPTEGLQILYEKIVNLKTTSINSSLALSFEEQKRKITEDCLQNVYSAKKEELENYRLQLNDCKIEMRIKEGKLNDQIELLEKENADSKRSLATLNTKVEMLNKQLKVYQSQSEEKEKTLTTLKKLVSTVINCVHTNINEYFFSYQLIIVRRHSLNYTP